MPRKPKPATVVDAVAKAVLEERKRGSRTISHLQTKCRKLQLQLDAAEQRIVWLESRQQPVDAVAKPMPEDTHSVVIASPCRSEKIWMDDADGDFCADCHTALQPPDPETHQQWCARCEKFVTKETT